MSKKITTSEFIERATKKHGEIYDYSKSVYDGIDKKIIIACRKHGEFKQRAQAHWLGQGCPCCGGSAKTTTTEFIERSNKKHSGFYDYTNTAYNGAHKNVIVICPKHGEFKQIAKSHLSGQGCRKCHSDKISIDYTNTQQEFIERSTNKHGGRYDYSKSVYKKSNKKVTIICPEHGEFKQLASCHYTGQGCPKCSVDKFILNHTTTQDEFVKRSTKIHNGFYDYSKSFYKKSNNKITIICPKHGEFKQTPSLHLSGSGCFKCGSDSARISNSITQDEFIKRAAKAHNGFYDYSKSVCTNSSEKVVIICPKHGEFYQSPRNHYNGYGCSKCYGSVSKMEIRWLNLLSVPMEFRQKTIKINGKNIRTDAADVDKKIAWEFYGDFWHGNLKKFDPNEKNTVTKCTYGELNSKVVDREKTLRDAGYTVISIWESDFKKQLQSIAI